MAKKRKPTHPGEILEEHYLKPLSIPKKKLAEVIGISRKTLHKLIAGESRITAQMAVRLSKALNTTPEIWLNLQQKYDLWEAEQETRINASPIVSLIPRVAKSSSE